MPRKLRSLVVIPNLPVHVIVRGNNCRRLFSYASDYHTFLRFLADALIRTGCVVHAVALMTNHVHLVVTAPDVAALSRCIKRTAQRYAVYRNTQQRTTGKLYEERFTAIPIDTIAQLALTLAYVELNPVRAGMVAVPGDHPWTTYRLHTGEGGVDAVVARVWTPHDWYLGLSDDDVRRRELYRDWVASRRDDDLTKLRAELRDRDDEAMPRRRVERPDGSIAT